MRDLEDSFRSLRGQLLIAHPSLLDPHFRRSVVLLSEHSREEGAIGVVLNRPLDTTLGSLRPQFADSDLGEVPVYEGGPVQTESLILAAWRWNADETELKLHFGIPPERVLALLESEPAYEVRAFRGHAGWGEGQIEGELAENAWLVAPMSTELLDSERIPEAWRSGVLKLSPDLRFLVDAPDDPSLN
ncbi:MAG: YqgE/AlgH family protein [Opitutales bacterium]